MRLKTVILVSLGLFLGLQAKAQLAVKTNLPYWATTTPNVGVEWRVARRSTLQAFYGLNPWRSTAGKSIRHWVVEPEYRHWFCEAFDGWFVGVHALGGEFNMGHVKLPLGVLKTLRDHRYEGWYAGAGFTAGYQWVLSRHWNFEASIGVGYSYIGYKKYDCGTCGRKLKSGHTHYVGPTKTALSLVYLF
ncbi:MAG: DUF3575 domain-containing protein [Prevotellaceae bacterium]|nr:DUF3575 domain-containing protein [Prevotellaceae bacterium]